MSRVPIGRRNLFSDRRRAILGILGVSVALLLMLSLNGIVDGAMEQVTRYIETSPADVFVAQQGVSNLHMSSSSLPLTTVDRIRSLPDVEWADPILYESDTLVASDARAVSYVIGFEVGGHGGPLSLIAGREPGPGEIVLDERGAGSVEAGIGDQVRVLGRSWTVSGLTSGLTNITNTISFVRFEDFAAARDFRTTASYVLVGARGAPSATIAAIADATGLSVMTREDFAAAERRLVTDMSAQLMQIMTFAAFLIGLSTIGLMLYTATLARLREVGVMKALGANRSRLAGIVLMQAAWTVSAALVVAVTLALALSMALSYSSSNVTLALQTRSVLTTALGGGMLGALGAIAPLIKVSHVDPATVFGRQS
jgi:putative ABC transport system permease protein